MSLSLAQSVFLSTRSKEEKKEESEKREKRKRGKRKSRAEAESASQNTQVRKRLKVKQAVTAASERRETERDRNLAHNLRLLSAKQEARLLPAAHSEVVAEILKARGLAPKEEPESEEEVDEDPLGLNQP